MNITRHRKAEGDDMYFPASAAGLLMRVGALRPDLMHVHLGGHLGRRDLALCFALSAIPGTPVVLTFHSGGFPGSEAGKRAGRASVAGGVLRRLDGLIGVNSEIVEVLHRFGVAPSRTILLEPHSISAASLSVAVEAMPASLRAFAASHSPFLLTVGLLEPEYSLELQCDSLPDVLERHPGAGLAIIGSGSLEPALRARLAMSPVRDHILLCGDVPHQGTLAAIARADVLLRPTQYDGDSVSVREALALGTKVLASDTGMRPPGTRLLPSLDRQALMNGILETLGSEAPAARGNRGEGNLDAVIDFYGTVMAGGAGGLPGLTRA
jgi:glycosyltransferase involved in cell wall biosynthesis